MNDKFTIEELLIRVMPGGFLLAVLFLIYGDKIEFQWIDELDFLYTFLFFCSAFIVGELLQTLAHELEWIINLFFKLRRPSKIFLYKENPILKNEHIRKELIEYLDLPENELNIFNKKYTDLSILWWKFSKKEDELSQSIFWKLYSQVSDSNEIIKFNRNYLFVRVIMISFLLIGILFFFEGNISIAFSFIMIFLLFLWRCRGVARGLVFKTVLLNLKKTK